jgi:uncharacterized protein (TIGR03663 family)
LRFIFPELKLLHHDEAIHAWFTYELITKGTYLYDPMYHGPLLYYLTGAAFLFFKDSDLIARLLPAFFGTLIIPLFWVLHREGWLSRYHAIIAALLFAISPSMVYFSRFLRHDIFQLFFTILLLVLLLMYFEKGRLHYVIGAGVAAACGLCLKEDMPFTLMIFGSFFFFMILNGRLAFPITWKRDISAGIFTMIGIGFLFYTSFFVHPDMFLQAPIKAIEHWTGISGQCRLCGGPYWYLLILALYELPIALLGILGVWQFGIREKKFQQVKTDIVSYFQTLKEKKSYFSAYQGISSKSDFLMLFALYWAILSMAFYAYVGEKVPWLVIHQLFPLIILASYQITGKKKILLAIGCLFLIIMTIHVCYTPTDINEPIVQVQNSEDMREVMRLIDNSHSVVVATESYWPLPWYYRGERWDKITFYGRKVEPSTFESLHPDLVITHDTESYPSLPGYVKKQLKLSYWFSWYDNKNRVPEYYLLRDGKMGSINLDVFVKQ